MISKIVIVGRPNVGKSSLLNLLAGRRVSIVDPTAGVTRDRVSTRVELPPSTPDAPRRSVEMIDTGGYGIDDVQDLTTHVQRQLTLGLAQADLVLFVVDAQDGIMPLDRQVSKMLRASGSTTPVILVANKVDGPSHEASAYESMCLGFGPPVMVSATSGYHKGQLIEAIGQGLDETGGVGRAKAGEGTGLLLAVLGKRNAGKSTLVNALADENRVIVSEVEGTTRDSVDVRFELDGRVMTAIDTAGLRKLKSTRQDIEFYSRHRTLRSIRRADLVLLLIDASVPVSQVDKQLTNEILKHHKPCVIVLNKWDLAQDHYSQDKYLEYLDQTLLGLSFAPVAFVSASHGEGLRELAVTCDTLHRQAGHRVGTGELNRVVERIFAEKTPRSGNGRRPKVYYATQLDIHPPTIALFVNEPTLFDPSYRRFLINRFRDELPFPEVPIRLMIRGKRRAVTASENLEPPRWVPLMRSPQAIP